MKGIVIPTNLAALALMAAKEEGRYAISGVRVLDQNGAYRLEATDGRKLAIVRGEYDLSLTDGPSPLREFTVPAGLWRDAMQALAKIRHPNGRDSAPAWLSAKGNDFRFEGKDFSKGGPLLEGKFPPTEQALPKQPPLARARFNPAFLKTLCEVALALGIEGVDLLFYKRGNPLGLVGHNEAGQFLDALVMPLDDPEPPQPVNRVPSSPPAPEENPPAEDTPSEVENDKPEGQNGTGHNGNGHVHDSGNGKGRRKGR